MTRAEMIAEIRKTQEGMRKAGPIHRRDLGKHLRRMLAQLRQYDDYQAQAGRKVG